MFVHPWDMLAPERMSRHWLPWLVGMPAELALAIASVLLGGVLDKLPKLRLLFAHGGGAFPGLLGRVEAGFHARPDLAATATDTEPREAVRRIYVDSLTHDPDALRFIAGIVGEDRIALGTDYPFPLGEAVPGATIEALTELPRRPGSGCSPGPREAFLGRSAVLRRMTAAGRRRSAPTRRSRSSRTRRIPLAPQRERFHLPVGPDGSPRIYLAGQSLGAQPRSVRAAVEAELDAWAALGVQGHFHEDATWVPFDEPLREPTARLVGALPDEVSTLNTLTVNLHLLLASFFRPAGRGRSSSSMRRRSRRTDTRSSRSSSITGWTPREHLVVVGPRAGRVDRPDRGPGGAPSTSIATRSRWPCSPA